MPPSTVGSTMTFTSTFLPVAWLSASREALDVCSSSSGTATADLGDLVLALGRRELDEPVDDLRRARRPGRRATTNEHERRRWSASALPLEQVLDDRDPPLGGQRPDR